MNAVLGVGWRLGATAPLFILYTQAGRQTHARVGAKAELQGTHLAGGGLLCVSVGAILAP